MPLWFGTKNDSLNKSLIHVKFQKKNISLSHNLKYLVRKPITQAKVNVHDGLKQFGAFAYQFQHRVPKVDCCVSITRVKLEEGDRLKTLYQS
jgi:hypothetical protein